MSPVLTIAIPYYRGERFLALAIESVLAQTDPAWELIVSDDGPDDSAGLLVARYGDPRIRYRRNPTNLGMAGNWNACLDATQTDLVTLLHADDELRPGYVAGMKAAADWHPHAAVLFCWAEITDAAGRPVFSLPDFVKRWLAPSVEATITLAGEAGLTSLARGNYLFCPTACYRMSRVGFRRFSDRWKFVLDIRAFTDLLLSGEELVLLPDRLYAYRRHANNATAAYTQSRLRFHEEDRFYDDLATQARERGWNRAAVHAHRRWIHRLNATVSVLKFLLAGQFHEARQAAADHIVGGM